MDYIKSLQKTIMNKALVSFDNQWSNDITVLNLKLSNESNSTIIDEDCFTAYCYCWMYLFKGANCV